MTRLTNLILLLCLTAIWAVADDWPTYMHDYTRGGITTTTLTFPLRQSWVYRAPAAPKPAWPDPQQGWTELPKMKFDDALYTIAVGDRIFFGSSIDNKVYALDAATGAVRWSFFTDGPVRLAPTWYNGNLYVGSDDGNAYCLNAEDGQLRWLLPGVLKQRRVLGGGRVISIAPLRTSVVVDRDTAYFGAGVFRMEGQALVAADAAVGKERWRNADPSKAVDFTPQGYLLADNTRLFAPSGRNVGQMFSREDGKPVLGVQRQANIGKGENGGVYGVLADGLWYVGTQNTLFGEKPETGLLAQRWLETRQLLAAPTCYYLLRGPNPPHYGKLKQVETAITALNRAGVQPTAINSADAIKKATRWRFSTPGLAAMILAGDTLIAGGENVVIALDAMTGKERWRAPVTGKAVGLTAAHGRLLVSTDRGGIYCFGQDALVAPPSAVDAPIPEAATRLAAAIVKETEARKGYAVLVGDDFGALALALARQTELQIYLCPADPDHVPRLRAMLDAAGVYGSRVTVDRAAPKSLPYPAYLANLAIIDADAIARLSLPDAELLRVVKPCGGVLLTTTPGTVPESWREAGTLVDAPRALLAGGPAWRKFTRGPLPGSGAWAQQYADAGNTGSSNDTRVRGGVMNVLWYGEPGAGEAPDRHLRGVAPLSQNGRVFFQGFHYPNTNTIICFDAYNGTRYWEREVPGAVRLQMSRECGNLALGDDSLYVAAGPQCLRLDVRTGEVLATYTTPPADDGKPRPWMYLAAAGPWLIGSAGVRDGFSNAVFAIDTRTNQQRWCYRGVEIRDNALVTLDGRVFFAEQREKPIKPAPAPTPVTDPDQAERLGQPKPPAPYLRTVVALDVPTGTPAWEKTVDLAGTGPWESQLLAMGKAGVLVFCGAYTPYGRRNGTEDQRRAVALAAADGSLRWNAPIGNLSRPLIMGELLVAEPWIYDLQTGQKKTVPEGPAKREIPWRLNPRSGACGHRSASASMTFYRVGSTGWYDIYTKRAGVFVGPRPGCWINIIPANGVVIQAEASSGCACYHSVQCTLVYLPKEGV